MAKKIKVIGKLIPNDWDFETDELIQLAVETVNDETYIIENLDIVKDIEEHVNQKIEVTGKVWEDTVGDKYIVLTDFAFL